MLFFPSSLYFDQGRRSCPRASCCTYFEKPYTEHRIKIFNGFQTQLSKILALAIHHAFENCDLQCSVGRVIHFHLLFLLFGNLNLRIETKKKVYPIIKHACCSNQPGPKPVYKWSVVDVQKWLRRYCADLFHLYSELFLNQDITGRTHTQDTQI